jgi:adenylosuccinate lyase
VIDRYTRPEMRKIWSPERRLARWLEVELAALDAMADAEIVPSAAAKAIRERARLDPARIQELEARVRHDVIAFIAAIEEQVGEEARWLHFGMTSSDVLDTALALELVDAASLLLAGFARLETALLALARAHRDTPMVGRSHGVHAEPTTFGLVALGWYGEVRRARGRLERARVAVCFGKISGAVGTASHVPPAVEAEILRRLGLEPEPVATQIVPRDRHAEYFAALAIAGAAIERIALQIRLLARTEVGEVLEPFGEGQRGSSAMPHKRNPILCENLCGLSRLLRGHLLAAIEDIPLWHERDISHSSVERVIAPDATILLDFMLDRMAGIIEGLEVHPERMRNHLEANGGLVYSGAVLLALIRSGLGRQDAYKIVQRAALRAAQGAGGFRELLERDPEVSSRLSPASLAACFDLGHHLRHTGELFERALEK